MQKQAPNAIAYGSATAGHILRAVLPAERIAGHLNRVVVAAARRAE